MAGLQGVSLKARLPLAIPGQAPALRRQPLAAVLGLLLGALALAGCTAPATGTLLIQGSDPPDDIGHFRSLTVHLGRFTVHGHDGKETDFASDARSIDVVQLQHGNVTDLLRTDLPSGNYSWIRLGVTSANGTLHAGLFGVGGSANVTVHVPSDSLKLNGPFTIRDGNTTTVRIDLHVVRQGNDAYHLTPVIGRVS
jgi:hypothetical protein